MKTRKLICFALAAVMMLCAVPALAAGNSGWNSSTRYVPESALEMTLSSSMVSDTNSTLRITFTNNSKNTNYSFGDVFSLEVARDGRWVSAGGYSGYYPSWGYTLAPGKSITLNLSLAGYDLSAGVYYRLCKSVYDERCRLSEMLYAEFYYYNNANSPWNGSGGWSNPSTPSAPDYGYYEYRYATERVNVRTGPGTKYGIVGVLDAGEQVKLTGYSGKWSQVVYRGQVAYVFTKYLGKNAPSNPSIPVQPVQPGWGTTLYTTTNLNLRKGPGTKYGLIGTIRVGTAVTFVEKSGNWSKVVCGDYTGYVFTKYLTSTAPAGYVPGYGWSNGWTGGWSGSTGSSTSAPSGFVPGVGLFVPGSGSTGSTGFGWR